MKAARESIKKPAGHSFRLLRWQKSLREVDSVLEPGKSERINSAGTHWHYHEEMELTLFLKGKGTRFVGDHIGSFVAGDLVLLGGKLPHYWNAQGVSQGISVQWHFPPSHPFWSFPENQLLADFFQSSQRGLRLSGETSVAVAMLMQELLMSEKEKRLALLFAIFSRLQSAKKNEKHFLSHQTFSLSTQSTYQESIAKVVRYVIANFREQLNRDDLLKISGLTRATFSRQFKLHAGRSFSELVNQLRIHAACRELRDSNRSVLEISLHCGFTQISFFNRLFRRVHGCSPGEYRAKKKSDV
jgi:AraC-like DNA-binding protein